MLFMLTKRLEQAWTHGWVCLWKISAEFRETIIQGLLERDERDGSSHRDAIYAGL